MNFAFMGSALVVGVLAHYATLRYFDRDSRSAAATRMRRSVGGVGRIAAAHWQRIAGAVVVAAAVTVIGASFVSVTLA